MDFVGIHLSSNRVYQALAWRVPPGVTFQSMTLWHVLLLICFGISLGGALGSAQALRVGAGGYTFSALIGVTVGLGLAWIMNKTGGIVYKHFEKRNVSVRQRYSKLPYFVAILWITFAGLLGSWITSTMLRALKF